MGDITVERVQVAARIDNVHLVHLQNMENPLRIGARRLGLGDVVLDAVHPTPQRTTVGHCPVGLAWKVFGRKLLVEDGHIQLGDARHTLLPIIMKMRQTLGLDLVGKAGNLAGVDAEEDVEDQNNGKWNPLLLKHFEMSKIVYGVIK